ncbi:hypothetical protein AVEN_207410-1 [Araneus ventricosus]|uniref:Uncharacterized protein n=1 Tax=Araneus ventricosus TaxID=182803 RepID=A0A4Y2J9E5_ARAVE|nr:hypothetical protein AVEN_207410-1 [Araneus ventricosus]
MGGLDMHAITAYNTTGYDTKGTPPSVTKEVKPENEELYGNVFHIEWRHQTSGLYKKRLQSIADNADRKAHNLYLNHTQATPNVEYVDYEDEETDCSSDISVVDLNLYTYKPSTSNRLISLTDPKQKQLTPFVSKSSQMRLGRPSIAVVGDSLGISDRLWLQLV